MNHACSEKPSKPSPPSIYLEIDVKKDGEPLEVRVIPREVSPNMVLLEVDNPWFSRDPATIQGKKATLRLMDPENQESINIAGTILSASSQPGHAKLVMKFAKPNKPVSKILGDLLTDVPKDLKRFWELWDDTHMPRTSFLARLCGLGVGKITRSFTAKRENHA